MKIIINTDQAPAPIGPYNQAVAFNGLLFMSGQIAINPATGDLIQDNIEAETHRVMDNIGAILTKAGATFEDILKSTVFLKDMADFARFNAVYGSYFNHETAPARETVQVVALPKNVNVEISVIVGLPVK